MFFVVVFFSFDPGTFAVILYSASDPVTSPTGHFRRVECLMVLLSKEDMYLGLGTQSGVGQ